MKIFTQMTYCNFVLRISTLVILSWGNAFASTLENAPPHVDAVSERLTEWIHNGICGKSAECSRTNKKLYIACVTPTCEERGVYSSDPKGVTVNETMLRIPVEYVLTADHVLLERRYPGIHKKLPSLEPANSKLNVICMLLAAEIWLRGSDSDLAPWLAALPKRMHTPVWWETVEIQEFLMPDERDSVLRLKSEPREIYRHHFKTSWPKVVQYFVDHFPSVAKSLTQWPARRNSLPFQQFLRVYSIVESRAWSLKGQRYLVPGADMFNHNYTETDRIEPPANFMRLPRSQNFVNTHLIHSDWLEIRADQPALVDTQLFESYGDSSTETYFQFFGFVPERNPYDCVPIQSGECLYWGQIWSMSDLRIRQNLQEMILRVRNFVHRLQFLPDGENADFELRKELSIKFYRQKLLLYENVRDSYRRKISEHREL